MAEQAPLDAVVHTVREIFGDLLGIPPADIALQTSFLELGAESLLLMRASQAVSDRLGVKVPFRDLLGRYTSVERLAEFVLDQGGEGLRALPQPTGDGELVAAGEEASTDPPRAVGTTRPAPVPAVVPEAPAAPAVTARWPEAPRPETSGTVTPPGPYAVMQAQLELMMRQLELLGRGSAPAARRPPSAATPQQRTGRAEARDVFIPYTPIRPHDASGVAGRAREHLERLANELQARTAESKRQADLYRPAHADSRAAAGFQLGWKEIVYPIVAGTADGARFVDVDGNEYVDITMDYGVNLFGHNPPFIVGAIQEQLERGMPIGPYAALSGPTATMVRELTGVERVAFVNSGTEAVMVAARVARTVTHRPKIALFSGCFHGTFDGILARASTDPSSPPGLAVPLAPGVPPSALQDVIVAPFADPRAFEVLSRHADELAAILVEPVQSRRPQIQPAEWLGQLRELATRVGAALIFDEIITGFRLHPGGAQAWFGIRADLVTYGKVLGGGMPIGAVTGNADFMAAIDGGVWRYGDTSWPSAETTLFAGTFWKHPLVMAAAHAVQRHLREEGPTLQERLNARTASLVARLNDYFEREQVPIQVVSFASLFRFVFGSGVKYVDLFFYNLLLRGVYVWEGRTCYLSTAHTDEDISLVVQAIEDTVKAMRTDGLIPVGAESGD